MDCLKGFNTFPQICRVWKRVEISFLIILSGCSLVFCDEKAEAERAEEKKTKKTSNTEQTVSTVKVHIMCRILPVSGCESHSSFQLHTKHVKWCSYSSFSQQEKPRRLTAGSEQFAQKRCSKWISGENHKFANLVLYLSNVSEQEISPDWIKSLRLMHIWS